MNCVNDSHMIVGGISNTEGDQHCIQVQKPMYLCNPYFHIQVANLALKVFSNANRSLFFFTLLDFSSGL